MPLEQRKFSPRGKEPDSSSLIVALGGGGGDSSPEEDTRKRKNRASSNTSNNNSISPTMTRRRYSFVVPASWDMMEDDDSDDDGKVDEQLLQHELSNISSYYYPISIMAALTWFAVTAIVMWCHVLPGATEWWTTTVQQQQQDASTSPYATARMMTLTEGNNARLLPGGYRSVEEMQERPSRFPSIDLRTRVYMSNWYQPPCTGGAASIHSNSNKSSSPSFFDDTTHIQYNYLRDDKDRKAPPLLVLQELKLPPELLEQEQRNFKNSGNNRTFVLDNTAIVKGARLFYMTADTFRECDETFCLDFVKFIFPALHRADMSVVVPGDGRKQQQQQQPFRKTVSAKAAYPGNALDATDGNTNAVVPVLLQFGDLEMNKAWVVTSGRNETYPVMPVQKKFRWSMDRDELDRVTSGSDPCTWEHRPVPMTRSGNRRLQPIISKLTYQRHFGMLDDIPASDIPWSEKKDAAVFRGALTGMKRSGGVRAFRAELKKKNNLSLCMFMQRCRLVYNSANSTLVDASLIGTKMYHSRGMVDGSVVPAKLNGVQLYGSRMNYAELLQYKALIMLEGNDISSGYKWALYSNSVVLAQTSLYTSWAMEELLEPWVHYIPLADDLSDVEEKMQWVLDHDEKAQTIARAGTLWISDLIYHPDAGPDEEAIFDNILRRYKQHFVYNPALSGERLVQTD